MDKLNTDAERAEITSEVTELKTQNESESRDVDSIFAEKQGINSTGFSLNTEFNLTIYLSFNLLLLMSINCLI